MIYLTPLLVFLAPALTASEAEQPPLPSLDSDLDAVPALALQDEAPLHKWTGSVNVGLTVTDGNTDTLNLNAHADAVRRGEDDRWTGRAFWNYQEQNDVITGRNSGGSLKYDYFATEKLYYLAAVGAESDSTADLDLRYYAGAGVGYQFKEEEKLKLSGEAGVTYFNEDFGSSPDSDYMAARLAYAAEKQLTETTKLQQIGEAFPSLEDSEDINTKLNTSLSTKVSQSLIASLQWVWNWDNTPAAGAERSDHRVVLGLGWTF